MGLIAPIGGRVADDFALAVNGAVGGAAGDFGPPIAVEIGDHELGVVRALADVFAEVDGPKEGAVDFVALEHGLAGEAGGSGIARALFALEDDLVFAVAIEIADGGVVGIRAGWKLQGNLNVLAHGCAGGDLTEERRGGSGLATASDRAHGVEVWFRGVGGGVGEVGDSGERRGVEFDGGAAGGGAVDIEGDGGRIGAEEAPGDEDFVFSGFHGDDAAS